VQEPAPPGYGQAEKHQQAEDRSLHACAYRRGASVLIDLLLLRFERSDTDGGAIRPEAAYRQNSVLAGGFGFRPSKTIHSCHSGSMRSLSLQPRASAQFCR
jgi:hypothetical protein